MKVAPFASLLLLLLSAAAQTPQATVTLSSVVKQTQVLHSGMNVDDESYLLKDNLLYDNEGFEQPTAALNVNCASVTGNVCVSDNPYATWPDGFGTGWTFRPQVVGAGASGVVQSVAGAASGHGMTLTLNTVPYTPHLVIEGTLASTQLSDISEWTSRGNGAATTETYDVGDGQQSVLLDGSAGSELMVHYFDNVAAGHSGTQLNAPYELHFMAKPGSTNAVTIDIRRFLANGNEVLMHTTQTLSPGWQSYVLPFTPAEDGTAIGNGQVTIEADNGSVMLDDISMPRVELSNPTPFRSAALASLQALQPGTIRFMVGTGYGVRIDDAISPINLRRPALHSVTSTQAQTPSVDYFQALQLAQATGARPWITIPLTITTTEMQHLIEWLAGSSATPYGAKRAARGQTAPWTGVFPTIYLELGNEAWNSAVDDNNKSDPETYGMHANDIFTAAHSSSSWGSGITLVADGWNTNSADGGTALFWEQHVRSHMTVPFMMSEAPYLYTSFNDGSSLEAIYGPLFAEDQLFDQPSVGLEAQILADLRNNGDDMGVYEENLGTNTGYAPQAQFDQLTGTLGSALAVADNMVQLVGLGVQPQSVFDFYGIGNVTNTGTAIRLWGSVVDAGGASNLQRPMYLAQQMVNNALLPTMLTTSEVNGPTYDSLASSNDSLPAVPGVQNLRSYAFTDGTQTSLVLFNMSRSSSLTTGLTGFPAGVPSAVVQLTSANITDINEVSPMVATQNITGRWTNGSITLPPFSLTTVVWAANAPSTTAPVSPVSPVQPVQPPAAGAVAAPVFTLGGGVYVSGLVENITGPAGSTLSFTTDGTYPTPTNGYQCAVSTCVAGPMFSYTTLAAVACINGTCSPSANTIDYFSPGGTQVAPHIASTSGDRSINPGDATFFSATMYGSYPFTTSWTRNGTLTSSFLVANQSNSYVPQATYQLTDDGAQFVVTFTNSAGTVTGPVQTLHVAGGTGQGAPSGGGNQSANGTVSPSFSLGGGTYAQGIVDSIVGPNGSTIIYTTDGSVPTSTHGTSCSGSVCPTSPIQATTTLSAIACQNGTCSSPTSAVYTIDPSGRLVAPRISYDSGSLNATPGAVATLFAAVYGSYPCSASWTRDGNYTRSFMYDADLYSAVLQNRFQVSDDGAQYVATFTNSAGTVTDQTLTVHVSGGTGQGAPQ